MESFVVMVAGVFVCLALLVLWMVSRLVKLGGTAATVVRLETDVDRLRDRLRALEDDVAAGTVSAVAEPATPSMTAPAKRAFVTPGTTARQRPPAASTNVYPLRRAAHDAEKTPAIPVAEPPLPRPAAMPVTAPSFADAAKPAASLEERLGRNWLNKLGITALVTGVVLLLGYQLRTLGPLGKSISGVVFASGILVAGLLLERRERYRMFARSAIGGGWALLYFIAFALFHVPAMQVLHSQAVDLALMVAIAVGMAAHSLRYRSQVVTSLAFLLGFFAVGISHVTLFSLVADAILATGLAIVAYRQRWFALALSGLIATYLNHLLWLCRVLPNGGHPGHPFAQFVSSSALLVFCWLLFRAFYILRVPEDDRDRVCSTLNALLNSVGLLTLLKYQSAHPEWAFGGLLALGTAELAFAFLARRRHHAAFVTLACIGSTLLLAAIPFHFTGASWSMLWLLQSQMLLVAGLSLRENVFRRLGLLSSFAAVAHLLVAEVLPVFFLRQDAPDPSRHAVLAIACACAAIAGWCNAEIVPRRWPTSVGMALDRNALRVLSYVAAVCAAVAAWLASAGAWTLLPWLIASLLLALLSDRFRSTDLAQQADGIALAAVLRAVLLNFAQWDRFAHAPRVAILLASCAMLYAHMRRRQPSYLLPQVAIASGYTWAAATLLGTVAWYALQPAAVAVAWCVLGTVLVETGLATERNFFRRQGFVLLTISFVRLFFANIDLAVAPRLYTVLPLAALYAFVYQRLHKLPQTKRKDAIAGAATAWFSLGTVTALVYFSVRPAWVCAGGAMLVGITMLLARVLRRPLFTAQALALLLLTAARTLAFNVLSTEPLATHLTASRSFTVGLTCTLLLAALPLAFSLRKQQQAETTAHQPAWLRSVLARPEQMLFFAPLAILFAFVPMQLRAGMITVGWSTVGLLTFLFALAVKERSFRLAGLGLLLVGVGKIVTVDIWHAAPMDRYITLIVMGAALLLVSFLYSRFRETILELL